MIKLYFVIAAGGALGACLRYFLTTLVQRLSNQDFAWGTLFVNILGSFLIGICYVLIHEKAQLPLSAKPFIMTGVLGAFTTFSTFSLDTIIHIHQGQWGQALLYSLLSLILCFVATFIAIEISRQILA